MSLRHKTWMTWFWDFYFYVFRGFSQKRSDATGNNEVWFGGITSYVAHKPLPTTGYQNHILLLPNTNTILQLVLHFNFIKFNILFHEGRSITALLNPGSITGEHADAIPNPHYTPLRCPRTLQNQSASGLCHAERHIYQLRNSISLLWKYQFFNICWQSFTLAWIY